MRRANDRALAVTRPLLQVLTGLNIVYSVLIFGLLAFSFFITGWPENPFGPAWLETFPGSPTGLRVVVLLGLVGAGVLHVVLRRLIAIVDTVLAGDPFIEANARRLEVIAWCVAGLEALRLVIVQVMQAAFPPAKLAGFAIAPWMAVLLLFVLVSVFRHGTRLRADLDGTV